MTIDQLYRKWCEETKRGGGVLIGKSIKDWTDYLIEYLKSGKEIVI